MGGLLYALRIALGVILVWASIQKLRTPREFISGVGGYRLLPSPLVAPVAIAVLAAEALTGALLVVNFALSFAVLTAMGLFALFSAVLTVSLVRKSQAPCFCFGSEETEPISASALVRTGWLLILSAATALITFHGAGDPLGSTDIVPALTMAAAIVIATHLVGAFPFAVRAFRSRPSLSPTTTPRISFRSAPLELSLKQAVTHTRESQHAPIQKNGAPHG